MKAGRLLLALVLGACTEYSLNEGSDVTGGGTPDILVDPSLVSAVHCNPTAHEITISNTGDGDLTIYSVELEGDGWAFGGVATPFTLAPGASAHLEITGTTGSATLYIRSNDPDEPESQVPLKASADQPPTVRITSPSDGEVLPIGGLVTFRAEISDDVDLPEELLLTWNSDVDGELSSDSAAPDGTSTVAWGSGHSSGEHTITLSATDSCENQNADSVDICQEGGYTVDELDIDNWHFEGDASWDGVENWLQLTTPVTFTVGTAFEVDHLVTGNNVDIRFLFYIGGGTGADGISLTALDMDRWQTYLGGTGCGIGYGGDASCTEGPALPGWSLEVDTYYNEEADPTPDDHLAFTVDGDVDDPVTWTTLPEMEDTGWHEMQVSVTEDHLLVIIDGVTYFDTSIPALDAFPASVGFTAATGSLTNYHLIDALEVTEYVCSQ